MTTEEQFGFVVEFQPAREWEPATGWRVYLPHQCDQWRIDTWSAYNEPSTQADALAKLDAFIAEAQAAREALAAGKTYGEPS